MKTQTCCLHSFLLRGFPTSAGLSSPLLDSALLSQWHSRQLNCRVASLTLPPSCPPWLHGRYPLHRSYEDSDSCSAPFCTRTGILGSCTDASGHSVSTHVIRPCASDALALAQAWPPTRFGGYRRFFGFRTLLAVSSVVSSRIEFVLGIAIGFLSLRTILSLPVALHPTSR